MLPAPVQREVTRILAERREFPVVDVVDSLKVFAQPELLATDEKKVDLIDVRGEALTETIVAPVARTT